MTVSNAVRRTAGVAVGVVVLAFAPVLPAQAAAPVVTVTSPVAGATPLVLTGDVAVTFTGSTDTTGTDFPDHYVVIVGTTAVAVGGCGQTVPATLFDCAVTDRTFDATGLSGTSTLTVQLRDAGDAVLVSSAPIDVQGIAPTIALTAPAPGPVTGVTTVTATASTDATIGAGTAFTAPEFTTPELPTTVTLLVGGVPAAGVAPFSCPLPLTSSCDATFSWDATGLGSGQSLSASVTTDLGRSATSSAVLVTPQNPAPTVAITFPTAGGTVSGLAEVDVTAATTAGLTEYPTSVDLLVGGTLVGTLDCPLPQTVSSCSVAFPWDVSGLAGPQTLTAHAVTTRARTADSAAVGVTVDNTAPTVSITSPTSGSSLAGVVHVAVTASTAASVSDVPHSIALYDGVTLLSTRTCVPVGHTCSGVAFTLDRTGVGGTLALQATVTTTLGVEAVSPPVPVTLLVAPPAVAIATPVSKAVVSGTAVAIRASATTVATRSDFPTRLSLVVDGVTRATLLCTVAAQHVCTKTFTWNASHSVGPHVVAVTTRTDQSFVGRSSDRTVYAASSSRVVLSTPAVVRAGATVAVRGRVLATTTGAGVAGIVVSVTRRPAFGSATTVRVRTGPGGTFAVAYSVRSNATVTAVVNRAIWLGASTGSTRITSSAPMTCSLSTRSLRAGAVGKGSCSVPGLRVGTRLSLRYVHNGVTTTLASGTSRSTTIPFTFGFPSRGSYSLRVDLVASTVYVATRSALMPVSVT
jgi:hypothetical protein